MNTDEISDLQDQAWQLLAEGRLDEAGSACREALRLAEAEEQSSADVANLLTDIAEIERDRQNFHEAADLCERALGILNALTETPGDEDAGHMRCRTLQLLGAVRCTLGDYPSSRINLRAAVAIAVAAFGDESPEAVSAKNDLGVVYKHWGYFDEALSLYRQALRAINDESCEAAALWHNVGGVLHAQGKFAEAEEPARKAWEISRKLLGEDHPRTMVDAVAYAAVLDGLMKYEQSETLYRHALEVLERAHGSTHLEVAATLHNLAALLAEQYRYEEAEEAYRRALNIKLRLLDPDSTDVALTTHNLGSLLNKMGRSSEAISLLERSVAGLEQRLLPEHPVVVLANETLQKAIRSTVV
jgi:tetratricopeptide (TPR) repeat protein